jgi:hypothetical protein
MQFAVPQFTDVEDKIIGPFTLKQFLIVVAVGGLDLFFWSLLKFSFFFFVFALPTTIVGLGITFGKFNGRPVYSYVLTFIDFVTKPHVRVFNREEISIVSKIEKKPMADKQKQAAVEEPKESRLKKLAYLLDQKVQEEDELLDAKTGVQGTGLR